MTILLVEDEPALVQFLRKGLQHEGYDVAVATDGRAGLDCLRQNTYDLAILDVNLPYVSGFELCRQARALHPQLPVLLLTALDSIDDKETGFAAGADDYLAKPFEFRELLLRARVLLRRATGAGTARTLRLADLEVNLDRKLVTRAGQRIELSTREYALLEYLMINRGKVVSRSDITEQVWNLRFDPGTNVIDVYISYLRKKIDKGFAPRLLHTEVGAGYALREG